MRAILCGILLSFVSVCYGHSCGDYYCPSHKPGHFFHKMHGNVYPDYQYPRFFQHHYLFKKKLLQTAHHHKHHTHGFVRCYTREGYSYEHYHR